MFKQVFTCTILRCNCIIHFSEKEIKILKDDFSKKNKTLEDTITKLDAINSEYKETLEKLQIAEQNGQKLYEQNKQLQCEWQNFKIQRDQAMDEKESLLQMIERRNSEISTLKVDLNDLSKQLQAAVKAKLIALENSEEVESLKISLTYK